MRWEVLMLSSLVRHWHQKNTILLLRCCSKSFECQMSFWKIGIFKHFDQSILLQHWQYFFFFFTDISSKVQVHFDQAQTKQNTKFSSILYMWRKKPFFNNEHKLPNWLWRLSSKSKMCLTSRPLGDRLNPLASFFLF